MNSPKTFYGWWIVAASFFTFGLAVGLPYFGMTFFYDYFERPLSEGGFGWSKRTITFGLPLGTLVTLWVGPFIAHRFPPRRLILVGTGLTALTFLGFGRMNGNSWVYWLLWLVYMTGNIFSGGLSHQVLLSSWFHRRRGTALSIAYLGVSVIGAFSARFVVKPLTDAFGFSTALQLMGALLLLTWPLVLFVMKDQPADLGLQPDGDSKPIEETPLLPEPTSAPSIFGQKTFWILIVGGSLSVGAVGAISQHLKLILKEGGFTDQAVLDQIFSLTLSVLLVTSAVGRLLVGWLADRFPKRHVLTLTFLLFIGALPFLFFLNPPSVPYAFAILAGLAMGGDFLLVALMAADYFSPASLARALAVLLAVMTVGQTWFPYFISIVREQSNGYAPSLAVIFAAALAGRAVMMLLPKKPEPAR